MYFLAAKALRVKYVLSDSVFRQNYISPESPASTDPGKYKLMSKTYETKPKHVRILYRPPNAAAQLKPDPPTPHPVLANKYTSVEWSAVNRGGGDKSDDDDSDSDKLCQTDILLVNPVNTHWSDTEEEDEDKNCDKNREELPSDPDESSEDLSRSGAITAHG